MAGCIHECNPVYECTVNCGWLYLIVFLAWLKYFWGLYQSVSWGIIKVCFEASLKCILRLDWNVICVFWGWIAAHWAGLVCCSGERGVNGRSVFSACRVNPAPHAAAAAAAKPYASHHPQLLSMRIWKSTVQCNVLQWDGLSQVPQPNTKSGGVPV